jgi:hypothetical protein
MYSYLKLFIVINLLSFSYQYNKTTYNLTNILNNVINNTITLPLKNKTITPTYLKRKSKFCHIKCNCFFSHNAGNDNIYVTNPIKFI